MCKLGSICNEVQWISNMPKNLFTKMAYISNYCRATPYCTVCEQANQPKLDIDCVKDIRVVEGEDFSLNINFTAFPMPTAQLWNEDVDLSLDSRVKMKVMDKFVSIILQGSVKTDDGHYR